jgi:hypothetical protein
MLLGGVFLLIVGAGVLSIDALILRPKSKADG